MKQMRCELLAYLADLIGKAINAGDEKSIEELSAWETFVQFEAPTSMIAQFYCDMYAGAPTSDDNTQPASIPVSPAQLSLF